MTRARRRLDVGDVLQAALDALEAGQRAADRRVVDAQLARDGDRRKRIEHVVRAGKIDGDGERRGLAWAQHVEAGLQAFAADVHRAHIRALGQTVASATGRPMRSRMLRTCTSSKQTTASP